MDFVSTDEFQTSIFQQKEADKVFHWKELPQGKIFKVLKLETFHSAKYNKNCYVLTLCDIKQDSTKVWATEFLVEKLTQKSPKHILLLKLTITQSSHFYLRKKKKIVQKLRVEYEI